MDGQEQHAIPADASAVPALLDGWLTRAQVATEIGVSVDTLQRWETRRIGPPCVRIGRKVLYRADAFREWLISRERGPVTAKTPRAGGMR
jgi:hypothetical protein